MRNLSVILFIGAALYGVFEMRRWRAPDMAGIVSHSQQVRRMVILALLLAVLACAFGGTFLPTGRITRHMALIELCYWLGCFLLAVIVALVAILEQRRSLREVALRTEDLVRTEAYKAMVETVAKAEEKKRSPEESSD